MVAKERRNTARTLLEIGKSVLERHVLCGHAAAADGSSGNDL